MKTNYRSILVLFVFAVSTLISRAAEVTGQYAGRCDIVFDGTSTLDSFSGDITNLCVKVACATNGAGEALLNTRLEIGSRQLITHIAKRDANMYEMFHADEFPKISVMVTNAPLATARIGSASSTGVPGSVPVHVTICGTTREIFATILNQIDLPEEWEFDLDADFSLKAFNLKPPTLLWGAIIVHDAVKVKAHFKLHKNPP